MAVCAGCGADNPAGARFCNECAAPLKGGAALREHRKTVTVVFCDLVGSTALGDARDPEALRALLTRYFERMREIVERHGGTVQKFIGDAVVAVFGVPVVHEDDALRALRVAMQMQQALPELGLEARIGVNSGEIVTSGHGTLVTGDAVNVAARLQQAAGSREILIGADTRALAGTAIEVEELGPLDLKGKAEQVVAFRLLQVGEAPQRTHGSRFVGRTEELLLLRAAWERALDGSRCELVTIVGEPGVGKSRLVAELTASLDARVARCRCLSYGEGITYFPVVELIKQLGALPSDPEAAAVIRSLLGESDTATSPDEIAWALRKLLEQEAPLLVVFDDIQWGEETFLDLVEHVALFSVGAPLLLLCVARPELDERRPRWPEALRLEPLPARDVEELLPASAPPRLRERIARAAGGNPLFVTEMLAMAADAGADVAVPATLKALLAARLDRLEAAERGVLERGAIEGEVFHRGPVQALAGSQVGPQLTSLVRRKLIRPDNGMLPGEDAYRFCHLLMRDAAYDALPKATRAELHERFADWLDEHGAELVERDELVGYHLQESHRCRTALGDLDDEARRLGERAAGRLAAAGRRATTRGDFHAVANLLTRALDLGIADPRERVQAQVELGNALYETARISEGETVLDDAHVAAAALAEPSLAALALIYRFSTQDFDVDLSEVQTICEQAIDTFAELGDERGLALARRLLGMMLTREERWTAGLAELERAVVHAEASGDLAVRRRVIGMLLTCLRNGATPSYAAIGRCEELLRSTHGDRVLEAVVKRFMGLFCAMAALFDEALELIRESGVVLDELNELELSTVRLRNAAHAKRLVGDRTGAERELESRWAYFNDSGNTTHFMAIESALDLASFYCDEKRWDEVDRYAAYVRDVPLTSRHTRREAAVRLAVEARLAAHRGRLDEAVMLAERGVEIAETMDRPNLQASIWLALAEVQRAVGRGSEADAASANALALYERKGNVAAAASLRADVVGAGSSGSVGRSP